MISSVVGRQPSGSWANRRITLSVAFNYGGRWDVVQAVRQALARYRPDVVECQDAYNLPWAALKHRGAYPETALIAGYMTDFPTVYVARPFSKFLGHRLADRVGRSCYEYCGRLYRQFDAVYALSEQGGAQLLRGLGVDVDEAGVAEVGVTEDWHGGSRRTKEERG